MNAVTMVWHSELRLELFGPGQAEEKTDSLSAVIPNLRRTKTACVFARLGCFRLPNEVGS